MSDELMGVILAAGKGTRMRPFSEHWPKPILPVLGKPLMAYQLEMMASFGIRRVVVVIGHLGHEVVRELGDGSRYGVSIQYVEQEKMLGIAHAVSRLEQHVDRPFFLFLGDIFFVTENLGEMLRRFQDDKLGGVLACKREPDLEAMKRNFAVMADDRGIVSRVVEKPRFPRTDLKGCGIYLFDQTFFDAVRRTPRTALRDEYEITDSIQMFLDDGYPVAAAEVVVADMNVSYPRDLLELNLLLLKQQGKSEWRDEPVHIAADARLDGCVVMRDAQVGAGAVLENCVLFPGARVPAGVQRKFSVFTADDEIRCDRDA
ncbi:MAG: sugar phosphate nucleotidyltransferase [Planctomycetota bacterium]